MKYTQKIHHLRGFTLVELMIVTAVLVVLAAVSVVGYGAWRQSVAQKEVQTDLQTVATAMLSARNFNDSYPTSVPSGFKASPNVELTYVTGSGTGYCVEAVSKINPDVKYYLSSNSKVPVAGSCAGIVLADESGSGTTTGPSCNSGDVLSGTTCTHTYAATYQNGGYSCPSGGALSGTTCTNTYAASYSSGYYYCSPGSLSGTTCSYGASTNYTCNAGGTYSSSYGLCLAWQGGAGSGNTCTYGSYYSSGPSGAGCYDSQWPATSNYCPSGGSLSGSTCSYSAYYSSGTYYCSGGATLSGTTCTSTYAATQGGSSYACPSGGTLSGTTCTQTYTAS